jgi:hypothetical protein
VRGGWGGTGGAGGVSHRLHIKKAKNKTIKILFKKQIKFKIKLKKSTKKKKKHLYMKHTTTYNKSILREKNIKKKNEHST